MKTLQHGHLRLDWTAPTRALVSWKGRGVGELALRLDPPFAGFDFRLEDLGTGPAPLGPAHRYQLTAQDGPLALRLVVDAYPQWPDALFLQWEVANRGPRPLAFTRFAVPELSLERTQPMWSLQGAAVYWGQDFAFPLPRTWRRENFLGHLQDAEGGGVPIVDFWTRDFGLALAHVEPTPKDWYLPVEVEPYRVRVALTPSLQGVTLAPGQTFRSLYTLLVGHQGDFFAAVARYREALAAQGLQPPPAQPQDYDAAWCSWGYEFDVRPQEVLGVIPKLQEMGIPWATLDDRWFDRYGDWNPRPDTFPGGGQAMRELTAALHRAGLYAQLWWYPLCAEDGHGDWAGRPHQVSRLMQEHPDWVVRNPDGSIARNNRHLAMLCPALPEVQEYTLNLVRRFMVDWDFDGLKLDNIYTMPPCYNPAHHHTRPEESTEAFGELYRRITEEARKHKPHAVVQICPCGTPITFSLVPAATQTVTADPTGSQQIRQRIKFYKALMGLTAPVFADHVELADVLPELGPDFASLIGPGGVPGTKFIWPADPAVLQRLEQVGLLDERKEPLWQRWFRLYAAHRPAEGAYLNLYDLAFDFPEGHALRKGDRIYYAFFAPGVYAETVELRGLEPGRRYRVVDYLHDADLGTVTGPVGQLPVSFNRYLLLYAEPLPTDN